MKKEFFEGLNPQLTNKAKEMDEKKIKRVFVASAITNESLSTHEWYHCSIEEENESASYRAELYAPTKEDIISMRNQALEAFNNNQETKIKLVKATALLMDCQNRLEDDPIIYEKINGFIQSLGI